MATIINLIKHITLGDCLDILFVAIIIYSLLLLIKDTKAYQMAIGIAVVGLFYLASKWGKLVVSQWLVKNFLNYFIIAVIVLFQGEIRRFLTGLGSYTFRRPLILRSFEERLEEVLMAVDYLAHRKIGALMAIEKDISLESYADRGTRLEALISRDLLVNIFTPHSPLHDGAVIIKGDKIVAAGCLLPLPSSSPPLDLLTRTRHLAALGLSLETDALVIVVSEETGTISLARGGRLEKMPDRENLKTKILKYLKNQ
ncbi:MAG: diadenylate cyclase CdaA [Candidatus Aminicenantes bacterium]|nr:diadenylate cyclase CdaA [Candidatus Aminicenantes bacterium]